MKRLVVGCMALWKTTILAGGAPGSVIDSDDTTHWMFEYYAEFRIVEKSSVWTPYAYARSIPFEGKYINVNKDGLRVTWNESVVDHADDQPPVRVFIFGGSTMWGWGARDDYTIASYLSKILHGQGYQVEVTNYGQMGYVNTQEIITLLRYLQRGEVPDIVLFYDGLNDVASANHNRAAGLSRNESVRAEDFNFSRRMDDLTETWFHYFLPGISGDSIAWYWACGVGCVRRNPHRKPGRSAMRLSGSP